MKSARILCAAALLAASCASKEARLSAAPSATYRNPVIENMADPHVLRVGDTYYLYATSHQRGYDAWTSSDLVNWTNAGLVFEDPRGGAWAPDVLDNTAVDGNYYLYYTDNDPDRPPSPIHKQIGVAVAQSPMGPFVDKGRLINSAIDAHVFRDDDGKYYLYYVPLPASGIRVVPMKDPLTLADAEPVDAIVPVDQWETNDGTKVAEGAFMMKRNGVYYLTYSATGADSYMYAIGYATAKSPLGPFEKFSGNPIASFTDAVQGPGHHCVIADRAGDLWMVYHQKYDRKRTYHRFIAIDPFWFDETGVIHTRVSRDMELPAPK